jgi:E3 ubiquitin-protein ligase UBR4
MPAIKTNNDKRSSNGRLAKLQNALAKLHEPDHSKSCEPSEQLILPTLGSQEGAFENVRMSYSGDQGQTIRQLVTTHAVRRVVMCCLASSPLASSTKRQHLAVAHEKGKITVLQLSALLKQADSSQKKLTLTRLASAPVPFTVLSIVPNPCNEDYLAVAGIKDCHILTFNGANSAGNGATLGRPGEVTAHLVLHPQLDANNYIIKTVWMPGSQTELALVTADFIKVYDLGEDALSPQYYFLVPSGKVRDCTLAFMEDGSKYVLIMSSAGHIYFQQLTQESSAGNGPFYVTNIMDVTHPSIKEYPNFSSYDSTRGQGGNNGNNRNESQSQHCSSEQICGGGVSIYYSQSLQSLFFSYVKGKSFMAPLVAISEELNIVFPIQVKSWTSSSSTTPFGNSVVLPTSNASNLTISGNSSGNGNNKNSSAQSNNLSSSSSQPLCHWNEIQGHPGLMTAFLQSSNNPVVIMVRPDSLHVQEIKVGTKAKIVDMVAIRHNTSTSYNGPEQRTTLILLCEDGSLKIYMAALGEAGTEFWITPSVHPMQSIIQQKPPRKVKKVAKANWS